MKFWAQSRVVVTGILFGTSMCMTAYASSGVPDWVRAAAQETLPNYPESTKAVVLLGGRATWRR